MPRLKLVLYLAEKCPGCEFIQAKMGNTISILIENVPNINFTEVIYNHRIEPDLVRQAFRSEADGVLILGCRPEDCLDMLNQKAVQKEHSFTELTTQENIEEKLNLSSVGGATWTSSN